MIEALSTVAADRRLDTHRVVPYTPSQVFGAFADPTLLASWWGPKGFTNTFDVFEFRDEGIWRFTMHGPDGTDYQNESRFLRLVEPSLVVIAHDCEPYFQAHFLLEDCDEGCKIDWHQVFRDAATCARVAGYAGDANEQNIDRLVAVLAKNGG